MTRPPLGGLARVLASPSEREHRSARPRLTRPERVEPTSQVPFRHRGIGMSVGLHETVGRWPKERKRHLDRPGCFGTGCVTGALLLQTSDSVPHRTPSLPGELSSA
jgi:hypothetical protein